MPFTRPSLATLIERIAGDIAAQMPGTNPRLRRALLTVLGRVEAGAVHGLYGHQEWIAKQVMLDTCDADYVARWAAILKVPRKAATAAIGAVLLNGNDGSLVPAGTVLARSDAVTYVTAADIAIAAGVATPQVTSTTAIAAADCPAGMSLTFVSPVAGVVATATVSADGIGGGTDLEDLEAWRARVLLRLQHPPKAGTSSDYVQWALDVPGVTRAWCYPRELGAGTVTVRFVTDDAPDGMIPDATAVDAVQAYIDSVCPVDATVSVFAPVAAPLDFTLHLVPDTAALRTAVADELADLLLREAIPGGTVLLTHIFDAIGSTGGVIDFALIEPAADVVEAGGNMATMGAITWV